MTFVVREKRCVCDMPSVLRRYTEEQIDNMFPPDGTTLVAALLSEVRSLKEVMRAACEKLEEGFADAEWERAAKNALCTMKRETT